MDDVTLRYATLERSAQVLDRQRSHADAVGSYLRTHADIADSTGALLACLAPLSALAVELGAQIARGAGLACTAAADRVTQTSLAYAESDRSAHEVMSRLIVRQSGTATPWHDPRSDVLPVGDALESAPPGHGDAPAWFGAKSSAIGSTAGGLGGSTRDLVGQVAGWGAPTQVTEAVAAQSFLVAPQVAENVVQDLRWNAGVLLGSVDWVAEQLLGFSILGECVFKPLGGDWRAIGRAEAAWTHGGEAMFGVARNCAALASGSVDGWQGAAGDAFRGAMTAYAAAMAAAQVAFDRAADLVGTVGTVSKLACAGIGMGLKQISRLLVTLAAEAAVPVIGWASAAATIWWKVEQVAGIVRLVYNLLETIADAINDFVDAKAHLWDVASLVEDLTETVARRAAVAGA
ncbi:hypothetical protein [Cellulomonas chengniuliangii]|uniref:hypothetical protein n=1 Tax=Cellulomonas chengniuliangii TaxID=2968084 RepID=UPI001D0DF3CF|nr:hypothetical protein [Cellulomonas chengniuliangii]MCC2316657.1 hypothetical protein [Cellulomonas chengniuliangii]